MTVNKDVVATRYSAYAALPSPISEYEAVILASNVTIRSSSAMWWIVGRQGDKT